MLGEQVQSMYLWYSFNIVINPFRPIELEVRAHELLSLFNEFRKKDKMRGLPSISLLFCNEFNKFNNDNFY